MLFGYEKGGEGNGEKCRNLSRISRVGDGSFDLVFFVSLFTLFCSSPWSYGLSGELLDRITELTDTLQGGMYQCNVFL